MNRPNADELMALAIEASEHWGTIPQDERPDAANAMARANYAAEYLNRAQMRLGNGKPEAARPWLLRALYLIGGALAADNVTTPEEPREERRYTRAEVDELLGRVRMDLGMLGMVYNAARNEADGNLRRAIAAETELAERTAQLEAMLKKWGA